MLDADKAWLSSCHLLRFIYLIYIPLSLVLCLSSSRILDFDNSQHINIQAWVSPQLSVSPPPLTRVLTVHSRRRPGLRRGQEDGRQEEEA